MNRSINEQEQSLKYNEERTWMLGQVEALI